MQKFCPTGPVLTSLYIIFYHLLIYLIIDDFRYFVYNISISLTYIIKFFLHYHILFVRHQFSSCVIIGHILIIWFFSNFCELLMKLGKFCWIYSLVDVYQLPSLMSGPLSSFQSLLLPMIHEICNYIHRSCFLVWPFKAPRYLFKYPTHLRQPSFCLINTQYWYTINGNWCQEKNLTEV